MSCARALAPLESGRIPRVAHVSIDRAKQNNRSFPLAATDQVVSDRWLQHGDSHGYARAVTPNAGGAPVSARQPSSPGGNHPTTNIASHGGGVAGPAGGNAPPRGNTGGLGLRPPPSLSFLPVTQQGYRAIKVSDDEVHQSINQGTTTGGYSGHGAGPGGHGSGSAAAATRQQQHHQQHHPRGGSSPVQQRYLFLL